MPNEEVWAETTDGGLLQDLFGHYPSLHDADIRSMEVDRKLDQVSMVLDYREEEGTGADLAVTIRLEWGRVRSLDLPLDEPNVFGLTFARAEGALVTHLEFYPGVFGKVVSETLDAILVQVAPGPTDDRPRLTLR